MKTNHKNLSEIHRELKTHLGTCKANRLSRCKGALRDSTVTVKQQNEIRLENLEEVAMQVAVQELSPSKAELNDLPQTEKSEEEVIQ